MKNKISLYEQRIRILTSKLQLHICTPNYCKKGNKKNCKFRFPFKTKIHTELEQRELEGSELERCKGKLKVD